MALSMAVVAVAGVFLAIRANFDPFMGPSRLIFGFEAVIIGGLGSIRGTIVAALLIGLSDGIISVFFSPTLAKIIATLAVALVLVFRPQGLYGKKAA